MKTVKIAIHTIFMMPSTKDLVEQILDQDIPAPVLTPDVIDGRIEVPFNPHSLPAPLVLEMDGEIASSKTFCNEAAEDNPGIPCLSGQNVLNSPALRLIYPLINVKRLGPTSSNHQLGDVVKDDDIEITKGNLLELAPIDMDRPVPHAPLMGAELSV
jgi:hypothetical protein